MFPGQGSQYVNMGRQLYEGEEEFGKQVGWCAEVLKEQLGCDLRQLLYPPAGKEREAEEALNETRITQPALFVVEYAMAKQLERWGIRPGAMIGHSLGEYVAACLAGVMRIEDALWLVGRRGEMMQEVKGGGMVAVMMNEADAEERIRGRELDLAAVNAPQQVVISGEEGSIDELIEEFKREGRWSKKLKTGQAYHSRMMGAAAARYVEDVGKVKLQASEMVVVSNVTGKPVRAGEMTDPGYWGRQMRECVRFSEGIEELTKGPGAILLEVGPGETLSKLVRRDARRAADRVIISTLRSPTESLDDCGSLTIAIGKLWMAGAEIDWERYHEGEKRKRVVLPTYPFERQRYWIEAGGRVEEGGEKEEVAAGRLEAMADAAGGSASLHPRPTLSNAYLAPGNDREKTIAALWQVALGVEKVGIDDNFFELGGDSLIAIHVISQLKEEFRVEIPVASLYERLTIRSVAALIGSLKGEDGLVNESGAYSIDRDDRVLQRKRFQGAQLLRRRGGQTDSAGNPGGTTQRTQRTVDSREETKGVHNEPCE
jgi:acyl transferase domain-containing protein